MTEQGVASENDLAELMGAREVAYRLLARLFLEEPDEHLLCELNRRGAFDTFLYAEECEAVQAGTGRVAAALSELASPGGPGFQELLADYTRLFVGPERLPAPPWESAYLTEERLLFRESTLQVRRAYRKHALQVRNYPHEADDHLGFELEFVAYLAGLARERAQEPTGADRLALQQVLEEQLDFLRTHLLRWIPAFAGDLVAHSGTAFYRDLAVLLEAFVEADAAFLGQLQKA